MPPDDRPRSIGSGGKRIWLYPEWLRGRYLTWRTAVHVVLIVLLLLAPWIDVGGHPAIRIDIPGRRIYFWGLTLFATDGGYLLFLFGFLVFGVFLFTALFGRAWCGWACPQTVFLESLVRPIERLIEGSPHRQRRLKRAPWTASKISKKGLKLVAFLGVAGAIGTTFTAYFLGRSGVLEAQADPFAHPAGTFTFLSITAIVFFDFAWFREQTCLVVCPYGRFQSVLLDASSLTVAYDARRGEPRGKKGTVGAGDCIDCKKCVNVCPTGIDIRRGQQMECIQCMACIDACDSIMDRVGRQRGLIRLSSEHAIEGRKSRLIRPRVVVYALGLAGVLAALGTTLSLREPVELAVSRQTGAPYLELPDGRIQNPLRLRIDNKSNEDRVFTLEAVAPPGLELVTPIDAFPVRAGRVQHMPFFVVRHPEDIESSREPVTVRVTDDRGFSREVEAEFMTAEAA